MSQIRYHLNWIHPMISQKEVESITAFIHSLSPSREFKLMPVIDSSPSFSLPEALELHFKFDFQDALDPEKFRESLWAEIMAQTLPFALPYAVSFIPESVAVTPKKLCVFDMDSTVINQEVIDELARKVGFYDEVARITEEAMQGKLDFQASLKKRCALLKGMPLYRAESILPDLSLSPGAEELVRSLRSRGARTAIVSGGFDFVLQHFQKILVIDEIHAHHLRRDFDDANEVILTGEVDLPIVDAAQKQKLVAQMKSVGNFSREQTITVGDGANDLMMMDEAGLKVSFCGKPKLAQAVNTLILHRDLRWLQLLI